MARIPVFYSFHSDNDVIRVQQIRNIGALDGNTPASLNQWERLKRTGESAVKRWIDENMRYKRCLLVLIGTETAYRPWVKYEIEKAWYDGKGVLGIYIHNLKCPRTGTCAKGVNPFAQFMLPGGTPLSSVVNCYDPNPIYPYRDIAAKIESWIGNAIAQRERK